MPCVATIGFFDGVHLGHRHIIEKVVETARQEGLQSMVVTFERHPRQVLCPDWHPQLLSTLQEKAMLLSQTGIDQLVVLQFDEAMAAMSAREFMYDVLLQQLGVRILVTGYDNCFGHREKGSTEGFADYVAYGHEMGMTVLRGDAFDADDIRVSSSQIRRFLTMGDVATAARCLGRPYQLTGTVVSGEHIGTTMGFPTANLQLDDADKLVPASGVYAVEVCLGDAQEWLYGMMNIGSRPTFGGHHQTLETHLFNYSGNLYGQTMTISFVHRHRAECRFDSMEALRAQLREDALQIEQFLEKNQITTVI